MFKKLKSLALVLSLLSLVGCKKTDLESPPDIDVLFIQCTYKFSASDSGCDGPHFAAPYLCITKLTFKKGDRLTIEQIHGLTDNTSEIHIDYEEPSMVYGYYTFTDFYFDRCIQTEETRLTENTIITDHIAYYFAAWG
ncbi:MAG: hypothetical protein QM203_04860 [Bacillota bacterium]|jgi:hypothetical protein|nr:hypothetical protein [Bacillota bacterium]